jgi:hypothetical protein
MTRRALAAITVLTLTGLLTACAPDTIELHVTVGPTPTITPHP